MSAWRNSASASALATISRILVDFEKMVADYIEQRYGHGKAAAE